MKKIILQEAEKEYILKQHQDFKKVLENKLIESKKGLMEQKQIIFIYNQPIQKVVESCFSTLNPQFVTFQGKTAIKVGTGTDEVKIYTDIPNNVQGGFNKYILNKTETKIIQGPLAWNCPKLEPKEPGTPYQTQQLPQITQEQKDMLEFYKKQGWKEERDLKSYELRNYRKEHVPDSEKYWSPNGIELYKPIAGLQQSVTTSTDFEKQASSAAEASIKACKKAIDTYWEQYSNKLYPSPDPTLKNNVQSCINQHYNEWGGWFSQHKKYDAIIDTLTRNRAKYEITYAPVENSPWLLKPRNYQ